MLPDSALTMSFACIFDFDGVIVDSSSEHERSWEALAKEEGRALPPGHFKRGFGQKNERIIPNLLGWTTDPVEIRRLSLRKEALFREFVVRDGVRILPGVTTLLRALRQHAVPCAIGSSTHRENLDTVFKTADLAWAFTTVITGEDVSAGKPDPEVFLCAARGLGYVPRACVVFEDMPVGVEAARRGGMACVGLTTTNPASQMTGADVVVSDLSAVTVGMLGELMRARVQPASGA